ncbi:hypothetical protein D9756_006770 [Leucocoprinus leucothites]|uniref:CsbD-like domain-containing protein n=1 Tax=Leucocoprinus leucothites TaxID=201217 RepID=A0A8H5LH84_9AGAR|nr:hypothetical protein D9756_006770 [Leucoagaricus leucothites]
MSSDPSKTTGQLHSTKGSMKETLGTMTGQQNLQQTGKEERAQGDAEYNQARAQGYAEGTKDRAGGVKDSVLGSITGDKTQQTQGNMRQDKGEAQQDVNRKL